MAFAETPIADQGKQPYKYNGKELDQMNGLNQYDYSARYYDPAITRFTTMDPMAEKYYSISPYAYCANNPVRFVDLRGDSIDVAPLMAYDNVKNTSYTQTLTNDLQSQTGLTISASANGQMTYAKDTNGNPIIATTSTNGNTMQIGSATARNHLMGLIDNQSTVSVAITNKGSQGGGDEIWLDPSQINSFISGSVNVDNRTLGWGMSFLHESYHTTIGGGLVDSPYNPGPVVTNMNMIRSELNALGDNYGQRLNYYSIHLGAKATYEYIPFNKSAKISIDVGLIPGSTPFDKFIRRKP
jgi:RHS repeat-associated protein